MIIRKWRGLVHIVTINSNSFQKRQNCQIGCGECKTSCQSAAKTDSSIDNQICQNIKQNNDQKVGELNA